MYVVYDDIPLHNGFATRSENFNEIVSVTSHLRETIVTIAFVNDFVQGGRAELYRLVAVYRSPGMLLQVAFI